MSKLTVHIIFEHGSDLKPYGVAYIRDILPLTYPANQDFFQVTHSTDYQAADIVIIERTWKPGVTLSMAEALVAQARSDQTCLVYSIDDNLLDLETIPLQERMVARYFCRAADGVIVSTEMLKERLCRLNSNILVVPNALDERLFGGDNQQPPREKADPGRKTIGFMGTFTHDTDLMMVLQPLHEVFRKHAGQLELQLVGGIGNPAVLRTLQNLSPQVLKVPVYDVAYPNFVPWMKHNIAWDLAIAPLDDTYFNRFKSDIKFLDYSALGIPGIYSKVPIYADTIRHLETGYLADNTPEEWSKGLEMLLADGVLRQRLASGAQEYVFSSRTLQFSATNWRNALFSIFDRARMDRISGGGERVTHLYPNDCYYAHLSLYYYATQHCQERFVLDAGSGAGYGAAYLADHGARYVWAIELSEESVAFSQRHFPKANLEYSVMDLQNITGFSSQFFDLIFSSNVLEHVPDVMAFFRSAWQLLKPEGILMIAVPPIVRDVDWKENLGNKFHLNIWTPRQWQWVIRMFFEDVQCVWHGFNKPEYPLDFGSTPAQTRIDERDFTFKTIDVEEFYRNPTLSVIFLAHKPRPASDIPPSDFSLTFLENSFTRSLSNE